MPNPSFEETNLPVENFDQTLNPIYYLKYWWKPTSGTTDYYYKSDSVDVFTAPSHYSEGLPAKDGGAYTGMFVHVRRGVYLEYLQTKLIEPLKRDQKYCVKMYVSLSSVMGYATDGIGIYFGQNEICKMGFRDFRLNFEPQILNEPGKILDKVSQWVPVFGVFTATGGEQYLIIGNFLKRNQYKIKKTKSYVPFRRDEKNSYYYIDDVSVVPINNESECNCTDSKKHLIAEEIKPNVYKNKVESYQVNFEFDKTELLPEANKVLDDVAETLKRDKNIKIILTGHTDSLGNTRYNQNLSLRRANVVKNYLLEKGIEQERIQSILGYGSIKPVNENTTEEEKFKNRRVEIIFIKE